MAGTTGSSIDPAIAPVAGAAVVGVRRRTPMTKYAPLASASRISVTSATGITGLPSADVGSPSWGWTGSATTMDGEGLAPAGWVAAIVGDAEGRAGVAVATADADGTGGGVGRVDGTGVC